MMCRDSPLRVFAALLLLTFGAGCDRYPRDPEGTLDRVSGSVLRVGISEDPPFVVLHGGTGPSGVDVDLLRAYAASRNARVEFVVDGHADLMTSLETFGLDAVAGGHSEDTPWAERVALSMPYDVRTAEGRRSRRVMALPPGENASLLAFDRFVRSERAKAILGVAEQP